MQRAEFSWGFAFPNTESILSILLTLILSLWSLLACIVRWGSGAHNRKQQVTQEQLMFRNLAKLRRTCSGQALSKICLWFNLASCLSPFFFHWAGCATLQKAFPGRFGFLTWLWVCLQVMRAYFRRADPFYDEQENHSLIGVANVFLECLFYDVKLQYAVPIINQKGEVCLSAIICPYSAV